MSWFKVWGVIAGLLLAASAAPAEENANLPLKKVVLFSSGIGYFQHQGDIKDQANVEFKFRSDDINDLLKSMVVEDLDGGSVSTVNYASRDPVTKSLKTFSVDLTANPTMAGLLQQVRGERVELSPLKLAGVIVGLEKQRRVVDKDQVIEQDILNLLTDDGLQAVPLESVGRIKLSNAKLDAELRKALAILATSHATDKKAVTLNFRGKGTRRAMVGYVQESPVWKTSYRLVLSEKGVPRLQGWAIVENATEDDWSNVDLTLVSGRPISFTMDLYQPLYVARPREELELYASLRPQVYGQDLAKSEAMFRRAAERLEEADGSVALQRDATSRNRGLVAAAAAPAPAAPHALGYTAPAKAKQQVSSEFQLRGGRSVANVAEVGELFQYAIETPVSLPRQQSAMLPIVNETVKGEKVSIYNPSVHAKHPLNGLRLTNSTKLHLMQGPITVFDDNNYAGDAKIQDLAPGAERLISYAMDLDTEVAPEGKSKPNELVSVRLFKGTMIVSHRYVRSTEYTVKNSGRKVKKVLIESPVEADWTLVEPKKAEEKTRDRYRFAVEAKPGTPVKLLVEEERIERQQVGMSDFDQGAIRIYLASNRVSEAVKAALGDLARRNLEINQAKRELAEVQAKLEQITTEQNRIRQNMERLDRASELYKRYVKKFDDQETEVESHRLKVNQLTERITGLEKARDEYLMGLDLQ